MFVQEFQQNATDLEKINAEVQTMLNTLVDHNTRKRLPGITDEQLDAFITMVEDITSQSKELVASIDRVAQNIEESNNYYMETQTFMRDYEEKYNVTLPPFIRKAWQV